MTCAESTSGTPPTDERLAASSTACDAPRAVTTAKVVSAKRRVMIVTARYVAIGTERFGSFDSSP